MMFVEITVMTECFLPLAEKLNIPVIGVVTLRSWRLGDAVVGNPKNRAVVPDLFARFSDQMSFTERLQNLGNSFFYDFYYSYFVCSFLNEIYQEFYSPELINKKKVSLVFMNNHLSLSARAAVPNAIDIGGIHLKPVKPLPKVLILKFKNSPVSIYLIYLTDSSLFFHRTCRGSLMKLNMEW